MNIVTYFVAGDSAGTPNWVERRVGGGEPPLIWLAPPMLAIFRDFYLFDGLGFWCSIPPHQKYEFGIPGIRTLALNLKGVGPESLRQKLAVIKNTWVTTTKFYNLS